RSGRRSRGLRGPASRSSAGPLLCVVRISGGRSLGLDNLVPALPGRGGDLFVEAAHELIANFRLGPPELPQALPQRASDLRNLLGPEEHEGDRQDEEELFRPDIEHCRLQTVALSAW